MEDKLNKSQIASLIKKLKDVEAKVSYNGDIVEMNVMGKLMQKKEQDISLKSIYEMTVKNQELTIQNQELMVKNQEENNKRLDSLENEIKLVKQDVKNLDTKVTKVEQDVKNLDTKLNKVIDLNKDIISLNKINVSKENKTWLFDNNDDNTPSK